MEQTFVYQNMGFSYKLKSSGPQCKVGISNLNEKIVWINKSGKWNDTTIFNNAILNMLDPTEQADTDNSYVGESPLHLICPKCFTNPNENLEMLRYISIYHVIVN
jgi:hypothetical protein